MTTDNALADGVAANTVTATFLDASGAPVANAPVTFTVSGATAQLTAATVNTDAAGVAVAEVKDTVAEVVTVGATAAGVGTTPATVDVTFIAVPDATKSTLAVEANNAQADGVAVNSVKATFLDASGAPVSNVPVTFTVSGATAQLTASTVNTDASGVAVTEVKDTVAEVVTVGAAAAGVGTTPASVDVTFSGAPDATKSTLAVKTDSALSDGAATNTVEATFLDESGVPVANVPVTFTVSGATAQLTAATVNTDASGVAVAEVKDSVAEVVTVDATAAGVGTTPESVDVTFIALPDATKSTLSVVANNAQADGVAVNTVKATFRDASGAPVANAPVTFTVSGATAQLTASTVNTDASGIAIAQITDTVNETIDVNANVGGIFTNPLFVSVTFGQLGLSPSVAYLAERSKYSNTTSSLALKLTSSGNVIPSNSASYSVEDNSVATVSASGVLTGVGFAGSTTTVNAT
ncbi:Ig-like domain-containing protein, partial [Enterobacter kobei]|nr:Ig-like domain-containing protein [Enterobacter kobei]